MHMRGAREWLCVCCARARLSAPRANTYRLSVAAAEGSLARCDYSPVFGCMSVWLVASGWFHMLEIGRLRVRLFVCDGRQR